MLLRKKCSFQGRFTTLFLHFFDYCEKSVVFRGKLLHFFCNTIFAPSAPLPRKQISHLHKQKSHPRNKKGRPAEQCVMNLRVVPQVSPQIRIICFDLRLNLRGQPQVSPRIRPYRHISTPLHYEDLFISV